MKENSQTLLQAAQVLEKIGQSDLIAHWKSLSGNEKESLARQLLKFDLEALSTQRQLLKASEAKKRTLAPFQSCSNAGDRNDAAAGKDILAQGLAGCLIVAGGQGSRLGFDGPKGMFPITPVMHKTLFQLFAEKAVAAGKQAGRRLPVAIMTSQENDEATRRFFDENHYFGMRKEDISFFVQKNLPFLDAGGRLFLETQVSLAEGPDGNGGALQAFYDSGLFNAWYRRGIRFLNFILVDNPLADPFDAELLGYHLRTQSDIVVKCTQKKAPDEKVGVLALENGRAAVVEYSELTDEEAHRLDDKGRLLFRFANLSLFCFSMDFISKIGGARTHMPLHKAFKAAKFLQAGGASVKSVKPAAWKFESFIFDLLPMADRVNALVYPREICFAPLKNKEGADSPETAAAALEASDRRTLNAITGKTCGASPLEISQEFYYPTDDLIDRWEGRSITDPGYVEA